MTEPATPHPMTRVGPWGAAVLIAVALAICLSLTVSPAGLWRRVTGQSGTLTVEHCFAAHPRAKRADWTCAGSFTPDDGGAPRPVSALATGDLTPGRRVGADAADPAATEVHLRDSPLTGLLLCPLALLAMLLAGFLHRRQ
jgi:hypothetical protein